MSDALRERCAGLLCVGFDGTSPAQLDERLLQVPFAGYILFARNVEYSGQTRALCDALQQGADLPRIIAIDQEGGRVARLREGVECIPPMMAVTAAGDPELAFAAGAQMAFDLAGAGVNVDFAPVLDLALFPKNTVIGARSFGDDPKRVTQFARRFAEGLRSQRVQPTYKHFPGHGSTEVDSHLDLPVIDVERAQLFSRDLTPFKELLPDAPAVMTAHVVARGLDAERAATLSAPILGGVLREDCRFEGVCFTDCMQMDAIARGVGTIEGSIAAIAAGADCILITQSLDIAMNVVDALVRAVEEGRIPRERIESAHERVVRLRESLSAARATREAPHPGVGREIARRAVTLIRGEEHANAAACVIVSFEGATAEGVQGVHAVHSRLPVDVPTLTLPLQPQEPFVDAILEELYAQEKRPVVLMRRAHIYDGQLAAVRKLLEVYPDALVVSTREPYDAALLPQARHLLCCYGDDDASLAGLCDVVFGGRPARGTLPVNLQA